jgi:hypothetical protein
MPTPSPIDIPKGRAIQDGTEMAEVTDTQTERWMGGPERCVQWRINDTGSGIARYAQERAFDPFFATTGLGKGIGLGLSTVYGIVRQSQGAIHLQSEPGQGAVFRLCVPSVTKTEAETAVPARAGQLVNSKPRQVRKSGPENKPDKYILDESNVA